MIRLVIYVIILTVSLIRAVSFYSQKKEKKQASTLRFQDLTPHREVSDKEREGILSLYKRSVPPGEKVYSIEGAYSASVLQVKGSTTETIHSIDDMVVEMDSTMTSYLAEVNRAEIIAPQGKKGALVLRLNENYSLVNESESRKILSSDSSSALPGAGSFHKGREISQAELDYLSLDMRILPALLAFVTLILGVFPLPPMVQQISAVICALSLILIFIPQAHYPLRRKKGSSLISLSGKVERRAGVLYVDRFNLILPPSWEKVVSEGQQVSLEGYPVDKLANQLKVTSLNGMYTIEKEMAHSRPPKRGRYILLSCLLAINLMVFLVGGDISKKIENAKNYYTTREMQKEFSHYDEIKDYPFAKGQEVILKDQLAYVMPDSNYYGDARFLLSPTNDPIPLSFNEIYTIVENLKAIQQTEDMIYLASYFLSDNYYGQLSFLLGHTGDEKGETLADFAPIYGDLVSFQIMVELVECYDLISQDDWVEGPIPYPAGGHLKEALYGQELNQDRLIDYTYRLLKAFVEDQANLINEKLEVIPTMIERGNYLVISTSNHYDELLDLDQDVNDFLLYAPSSGYSNDQTLDYQKELRGEVKLRELEEYLKAPYRTITLEGIVSEIKEDDGSMMITLDRDASHGNVENQLVMIVLFGAALLAFSLSLGGIVLITVKKNQS